MTEYWAPRADLTVYIAATGVPYQRCAEHLPTTGEQAPAVIVEKYRGLRGWCDVCRAEAEAKLTEVTA